MEPTPMGSSMHGMLERWSERLFIAAVFLFPIVVVPISWFPFTLFKIDLFAALLTLSLLLAAYTAYARGGFSLPRSAAFIAVLALPITYLVSALFSQNALLSFVNTGTEENTVFFVSVCALTVVAAGILLRSRASIRGSVMALFYSLCAVTIFQLLHALFGLGTLLGFSAFSSASSNVIGSWNDLGLMAGLLAVMAMSLIDSARVQKRITFIVSCLALVLSLALLAIVNLNTAWQVLAGVALLSALITVFSRPSEEGMGSTKKVPVAAIVTLILSVCFVAWGNQINTKLSSFVSVSELEVRPALSTTGDIILSTYKQSPRTALFGTGPGTFVEQWLMYKPTEVNSTQFWSVDFTGGAGVIPTAFVTTGLLGGLAWVLLLLLMLWLLYKVTMRQHLDAATRTLFLTSTLGALFLLIASVLYLSGEVALITAFILIGAALSAERLSSLKEWVVPLAYAPAFSRMGAYVLIVLLLGGSFAIVGYTTQRFLAAMHVGRALAANTGDYETARTEAQKGLDIYYNESTLRLLSAITLAQAQAISNESTNGNPTPDQSSRFQQAFADSVKYAQEAVALNPRNYQNRVAVAQLFEALVPLKVNGAYENAKQNYKEAIRLNPYNPGLFLAAARTEATGGSEADFKSAIQTAFTLKPNYTEAALLVLQVEIARNNLDGAIIAAQVAAATAPQNPGIYFQLGLLKYTKGDGQGAREAFEQALKLAPDYANAKYFLGLTYDRLSRTQEAVALFEDLAKSNPDNAEIQLILGNLKAGKEPFAGAEPPVTPNPEERNTPPIAE